MTGESTFSYVENLAKGCLELGNPFLAERESGLVCRYDPTRSDPSLLLPVANGVAGWQRLLPGDVAGRLPAEPVLEIEPWRPAPEATVRRVHFRPQLILDVALPLALDWGCRGIRFEGRDRERETLAACGRAAGLPLWPDAAGSAAASAGNPATLLPPADHFDFGTWGNPFRAEGLKLIGLTLAALAASPKATLVVHDDSGELLHALALAATHHRACGGADPYRVVLVQERPCDALCRVFEGAEPDWQALAQGPPRFCVKAPDPLLAPLRDFLGACAGTAISLEAGGGGSDPLFRAALDLLWRTGFVDEEDRVMLLSASEP